MTSMQLPRKRDVRQTQSRKCRARYRDVAKTTCGIRQSNYLPLLLYRIPITEENVVLLQKLYMYLIQREIILFFIIKTALYAQLQ